MNIDSSINRTLAIFRLGKRKIRHAATEYYKHAPSEVRKVGDDVAVFSQNQINEATKTYKQLPKPFKKIVDAIARTGKISFSVYEGLSNEVLFDSPLIAGQILSNSFGLKKTAETFDKLHSKVMQLNKKIFEVLGEKEIGKKLTQPVETLTQRIIKIFS